MTRVIGIILATLMVASNAKADGALDFADPCIEAGRQFRSTTDALRTRADQMLAEWDRKSEPPGEIRGLYVEALREDIFKNWSESPEVKSLLDLQRASNPSFDVRKFFLETVYPGILTPEKEAELVRDLFKVHYASILRPQLTQERSELDRKIAEQRSVLDENCKPDVFSQVVRATIGRMMLVVGNNFDAAKNERGEIAKLVRATSGISLDDIGRHGLLGGENSELRRGLERAGIGENHEVRKGLERIGAALSPGNWKIETPRAPPPIEITRIPGTRIRVCVPWC